MRFLLALALSLPLSWSLAAPAHAGDKLNEIAAELGLTDAQRTAVTDIVYKSQLARVDLKAKLKRAEMDLKYQLGQTTPDERAVRAAADQVATVTGELVRNRVERILAIRRQLTPEQWTELKDIWAEERDERGEDNDDE